MDAKPVRDSRITLTVLMGVGDANNLGNIHGGLIMKLCDEAAGMAATKHARRPLGYGRCRFHVFSFASAHW